LFSKVIIFNNPKNKHGCIYQASNVLPDIHFAIETQIRLSYFSHEIIRQTYGWNVVASVPRDADASEARSIRQKILGFAAQSWPGAEFGWAGEPWRHGGVF
jgi:hypothetical protein